jgi:hypothetical protein
LSGGYDIVSEDLHLDEEFRPTGSSPLIDSGTHVSVTNDFDGNPRPQGEGFDMGAFEFLSESSQTTFVDVPPNHWAYDYIEKLADLNYVSGCSVEPMMYCPEGTMTRAEGAVFVLRGVYGANFIPLLPPNQIFTDVLLDEWFAKWADDLWHDGFTAGCNTTPLEFCPGHENSRVEGTVFFLRMLNGVNYSPPDPTGIFEDVVVDYWGARWVEEAFRTGLVPACAEEPKLFCPGEPLTRAMAAFMMVQAKGLKLPK